MIENSCLDCRYCLPNSEKDAIENGVFVCKWSVLSGDIMPAWAQVSCFSLPTKVEKTRPYVNCPAYKKEK